MMGIANCPTGPVVTSFSYEVYYLGYDMQLVQINGHTCAYVKVV